MSSLRSVREVFTPDAFQSLGPGFEAEGPIFIVGMPRTGTTLLERLLGSHSEVWSVGEFTVFPPLLVEHINKRLANAAEVERANDASLRIDFRELGRRYLAAARQLSGERNLLRGQAPLQFPLLRLHPRRIARCKADPPDAEIPWIPAMRSTRRCSSTPITSPTTSTSSPITTWAIVNRWTIGIGCCRAASSMCSMKSSCTTLKARPAACSSGAACPGKTLCSHSTSRTAFNDRECGAGQEADLHGLDRLLAALLRPE